MIGPIQWFRRKRLESVYQTVIATGRDQSPVFPLYEKLLLEYGRKYLK